MGLADGAEVLIVDLDEGVRRGLSSLLQVAGLVPTGVADAERAVLLTREKFFAVAVVDLDTPRAGEGLSLISRINATSPATTVVMMASRKTFEVAVAAFRAGASDIVVKSPDQVNYLRDRVVGFAAGQKKAADNTHLVENVLGLHEEMMALLLALHKKVAQLEERNASGELPIDEDTTVLVVDHDDWMRAQLALMLATREGYRLSGVSSGGEALDLIGREKFQIALVRDTLPDLPGSMVVKAIKGQSPDTIALLYMHPESGKGGSVQVTDGSKVIPFIAEFADPKQILERLDELREAFIATRRERRYLASFRQGHFDLLKRYAELKQKLQRATSAGK